MVDIDRLIEQVKEAAADRKYANLLSAKRAKIVVGLGRSVLSNVLGFNLKDWFSDAKLCLESQLQWKLLWHREIQDDTIIKADVGVEFGVALEPTLFGMQPLFREVLHRSSRLRVPRPAKSFRYAVDVLQSASTEIP